MSKLKADHELQMQRRNKRNAAFDAHRDLDKIKTQRDNLSELAKSLRLVLSELAKYFTYCENDLNLSIAEDQLNASECEFNSSILSNATKRFINFKPDISNLIALVEDPKLVEYLTNNSDTQDSSSNMQINIIDCLDCLNLEANKIVELSDKICKRSNRADDPDKSDCCEDEDGLMLLPGSSIDMTETNKMECIPMPTTLSIQNLGEKTTQQLDEERHGLVNDNDKEKASLKQNLDKAEEKIRILEKELNEMKSVASNFNRVKEDLTEG